MKVSASYKHAAAVNNVWKWYRDSESALLDSRQKIIEKVRSGKALPIEFMFKSPKEIADQFSNGMKELKYATMLGLISAIEAAFRIDHQIRLTGKKSDGISRKLYQLSPKKKKGEWSRFGDDILKTWKNITDSRELEKSIKNLMDLLPLRDWLAHGRCWEKRFTQNYDPETIYSIAIRLMRNLPHDNFFGRKYLSP